MTRTQHIDKAIKAGKIKVNYQDKAPWTRLTPEERLTIFRKCGKPCFAKPIHSGLSSILADPKKTLKFPICRVPAPKTRKCSISAAGLLAANRRARLTKKYPEIVSGTAKLIKKLGTTQKARKELVIKRVSVKEIPLPDGKHIVTVVYANDVKKVLPKAYSKRHILKTWGHLISKALHERLSGAVKGAPSKTKTGQKDYTTKKTSKVFHRGGHYVKKAISPYHK